MIWLPPLPRVLVESRGSEDFLTLPEGVTGVPVGDQHPGAFGFRRANHVHEGVDLYCPEGTLVTAVEDGLVVAVIAFTGESAVPPSPWWHDTKAILVAGDSGVVLYGEIEPALDFWEGDSVAAGSVLGRVVPVLKKDKGRPMTMLHLELHRHGTRDAFEWSLDGDRPQSLLDPTPFLLECSEVL
jgi:murein DD-endopeptidase MepM/ murein hydrolase activator NlpD